MSRADKANSPKYVASLTIAGVHGLRPVIEIEEDAEKKGRLVRTFSARLGMFVNTGESAEQLTGSGKLPTIGVE